MLKEVTARNLESVSWSHFYHVYMPDDNYDFCRREAVTISDKGRCRFLCWRVGFQQVTEAVRTTIHRGSFYEAAPGSGKLINL